MGIVASSAPQLALAVARACAQCQLLRVADYFEGSRARTGVDREHVLQPLTGTEVSEFPPGIQDALGYACQMALFADAIADCRSQLGRIDDGTRHRPLQMLVCRPVAA